MRIQIATASAQGRIPGSDLRTEPRIQSEPIVHTEPITRLEDLTRLLEPDLELASRYLCDDASHFLTRELLQLSRLYNYGVFVRKSGSFQKMAAHADPSRLFDLSRMTVGQVGTRSHGSQAQISELSLGSFPEQSLGSLELTPEMMEFLTSTATPEVRFSPGGMLQQLARPAAGSISKDALRSSWYGGSGVLTRVFTEPDGHCMLHALLYATHAAYQAGRFVFPSRATYNGTTYQSGEQIRGKEARLLLARALREELIDYLDQEQPQLWGPLQEPARPPLGALAPNVWESINNGSLAAAHLNQVRGLAASLRAGESDLGPQGRGVYDLDYSLNGMKKLLASSELLGEEGLLLLSNYLPLNIAILVGRYGPNGEHEAHFANYYRHPGPGIHPCCLMLQVTSPTDPNQAGQHYEMVGLENEEGYLQTLFPPEHPLWLQFEAEVGLAPEPASFYQSLMGNVLAGVSEEAPIDPLVWFLLDRFTTRRTPQGNLVIFPGYDRLYHHLWIRSKDISGGRFTPSSESWEPKGLMPLHAHAQMTVQAIREAGGLDTSTGRAILEANSAYMGLWLSGYIGVFNGKIYPQTLKEQVAAYIQSLLR